MSEVAPGAPEPPPADGRRGGRSLLRGALVAVLAFATGLWAFNAVVMPRLVHGPGDVVVPDVENVPFERAEQLARDAGLRVSRAGERFDTHVPRGYVAAQDPPPGTISRGGRRVSVWISLGEEFASVPALRGESRRTVELVLASAGLEPGAIGRASDELLGEGLVLGTDPPAETVLPRGDSVAVLISTGPPARAWVMPDLLGRDVATVKLQLESFGFVIRLADSVATGRVVAQAPERGSRLTPGTVIHITPAPVIQQ